MNIPTYGSPLACNLGAMDAGQKERHHACGERLRAATLEIRELPGGFELRLPADLWAAAAEFVALERLCCPFLGFALELEPEGAALRLRMTGREGVKQFMRSEFGIK